MPDYLIFANARAARDRSAAIAQHYGCGPVTTHWFGWRVHPSDGRAALQILTEGEDATHGRGRERLTTTERGNLVNALPADWEPEETERRQ